MSHVKLEIGQQIANPVASAPSRSKLQTVVAWAGTCTSALCAVHCFGTAIIALLSPGLLKLVPHSELAEAVVLGISVVTAFIALNRSKASAFQWLLLTLFSGVGLAGLAAHVHGLLGLSLASLAVLQLVILWKSHHPKRGAEIPECCRHEHGA